MNNFEDKTTHTFHEHHVGVGRTVLNAEIMTSDDNIMIFHKQRYMGSIVLEPNVVPPPEYQLMWGSIHDMLYKIRNLNVVQDHEEELSELTPQGSMQKAVADVADEYASMSSDSAPDNFLSDVAREYDRNDTPYVVYLLAFRMLCAVRERYHPSVHQANEEHNHNDLIDDGHVARLMNVLYDIVNG